MIPKTSCQCSSNALQLMSALQNVQTVVDVETIIGLIQRICEQGQIMVNCKGCMKMPESSIGTLPVLSEQCLPLFDAVCSAYNISTQPELFDIAVVAFEQPPAPFICIRSRVTLGHIELDDEETRLLVRTLLARSLMSLVELMRGLKGVLRVFIESTHVHRSGTATLRACESSIESTMSRLSLIMQHIERGCNTSSLA